MKKDNRNRGFTLVELLITVVVLAIIVAPFLGLFVAASGSNVSASRTQKVANLAEDIAEEIKGKTLDTLMNDDKLSGSESSGTYTFDIAGNDFPNGMKIKNACARVTLVPNTENLINKELPVLENMSGNNTVLLMSGFYTNDPMFSIADSRKSAITISKYTDSYGTDKYMVSLEVGYYKGGIRIDKPGKNLGEDSSDSGEYSELPAVFAIYPQLSPQDEIYLINTIEEDDMPKPLEFYLSIQQGGDLAGSALTSDKIKIKESLYSAQEDLNTYSEDLINIHTDVVAGGSLVKKQQKDKLYDLTVVIKRGNNPSDPSAKILANFKSSKLSFN